MNKFYHSQDFQIFLCDEQNILDEKNKLVNQNIIKNSGYYVRHTISSSIIPVKINGFFSCNETVELRNLITTNEGIFISSEVTTNESYSKIISWLIKERSTTNYQTPIIYLPINADANNYYSRTGESYLKLDVDQKILNKHVYIYDCLLDNLFEPIRVIADNTVVTIEENGNCLFVENHFGFRPVTLDFTPHWFPEVFDLIRSPNKYFLFSFNMAECYFAIRCILQIVAVFAAAFRRRMIHSFLNEQTGASYLNYTVQAVIFLLEINHKEMVDYLNDYAERLKEFPTNIYDVLPWLSNLEDKPLFIKQMTISLKFHNPLIYPFHKVQIIIYFFELLNRKKLYGE